jgi:hypothetical protein
MRAIVAAGYLAFLTASSVVSASPIPAATTTGWFACDRCAPARLKAAELRPVNRECAQRCLADGAKMLFINEKPKGLLRVLNPAIAKGQEGHYVRVTGSIDSTYGTLNVESIKVLEEYVAYCARRPQR